MVSDGSAILGIGNLGAEAAIPVMEGKAVLFKEFAGVDAFPICLATQDVDEIVRAVRLIAPVFGGINLEDISAPRCFEVEARLQDLGIPVFHDDQHGTAIVVMAALLNALKVTGKTLDRVHDRLQRQRRLGDRLRALDSELRRAGRCRRGRATSSCAIRRASCTGDRTDLNPHKRDLAGTHQQAPACRRPGRRAARRRHLHRPVAGQSGHAGDGAQHAAASDHPRHGQSDSRRSCPMRRATPAPRSIGTGRSDFPNQINNVLAFPGVFRGALDAQARVINEEMKIAAAEALAGYVIEPTPERILPDPLDKQVASRIGRAVATAARDSGVCR